MIGLISIIILTIAVALGLIFYLRYRGSKSGTYNKNTPLFLSGDETIEFLGNRAELSPEEKAMLEKLITIGGTNRLHTALDGAEVGRKWLINTRKLIQNSISLSNPEKDEHEYFLYEIFRKISLARAALHPQLMHLKNISTGQSVEIKVAGVQPVVGDIISANTAGVILNLSESDYHIVEASYQLRSKVSISFWKEMDAGYSFKGEVEFLTRKKQIYEMSVKATSPLKRSKVRKYPRKATEIPARFRVGSVSVDEESGALKEQFDRLALSLINEVSPKGCVLLSHMPVAPDTNLSLEFPLLDKVVKVKSLVRSLTLYDTVYSIGLEFIDIPRSDVIYIYRFIYPEDN
ncbi:MAG: hypothetical protein ACRCY4_01070 [Brevinema sp.]